MDQARLDERLQEVAAPYGEPEQVIAFYRSNPEQMQTLEMGVLEDQVVDHIMSQAEVEELASNYDDIMSGAAIAPAPGDEDSVAANADDESANQEQQETAPEQDEADKTAS